GSKIRRKAHREPMEIGFRPEVLDVANAVHVPLNEMPSEPPVGTKRPFEVHTRAHDKPSQRGDAQRLGADIGPELVALDRYRSEAYAVDGDAVSRRERRRQRRINRQPRTAARRLTVDDFTDSFNEAREHNLPSSHLVPATRRAARSIPTSKNRGRLET